MSKVNKDKWSEVEVKLSDNSSFKIVHNLPDQIEAAIANWEVRTSEYTARSLCDYINLKRLRGLTDHYAYTEEEFKKLQL